MTRGRVKLLKVLMQIINGYMKSLYGLFRFGFVIALLAGVSIAIIFPLWFFSTNFKEMYTIFTIAGLSALCFMYLITKIVKIIKQSGINEILLKIGKICTFFMCLALLGTILLFYVIFFAMDQFAINILIKESLFISLLVLSIIYIYTISVIRANDFLLLSVYRIIMGCAVAGFAYFVLLLLIKGLYVHFICSFVLYTACFGYLLYSHKGLLLKHKQRVNEEE